MKYEKPENTKGKNNSGKNPSKVRAIANTFWGWEVVVMHKHLIYSRNKKFTKWEL